MSLLPVAVIDSGIIENTIGFRTEIHQIDIRETHWWMPKQENKPIVHSHGTVVSAILSKYASDIEIYSLRVFYNDSLTTDCRTLVNALSWCCTHKIPLINLSLGTVEKRDFKRIESIVTKMTTQGQIIISAYHMNGSFTMPASHPAVIGVQTASDLEGNYYYPIFNNGKCDFVASSRHHISTKNNTISFQTEVSSSYAVPTITAAFANCMVKYPGRDQRYYSEMVKNGIQSLA